MPSRTIYFKDELYDKIEDFCNRYGYNNFSQGLRAYIERLEKGNERLHKRITKGASKSEDPKQDELEQALYNQQSPKVQFYKFTDFKDE